MNICIRYFIRSLFMLIGFGVLLTSCLNNSLDPIDTTSNSSTIKLNILADSEVITRSSESRELSIVSGYIFTFGSDGSQKSHYVLKMSDITDNGSSTQTIVAPIKIYNGDKVSVVLNSTANVPLESVTLSTLDSSFLLDKVFDEAITGGLPMYGFTTWSESSPTPTIIVKRSVAKIQVVIDGVIGGPFGSGFDITNVTYQLYNYATKGNITSLDGVVNGSDNNAAPVSTITDGDIVRSTSSLSDDFTGSSYLYEYDYSTNIIGASGSKEIDITLPNKDRLAIILKNGVTNRYYRLDLIGADKRYSDILRNHRYKVVIRSVNSNGYATAQAALEGSPNNIDYVIEDDTGNSTVSNGLYAISVGEEFFAGDGSGIEVPGLITDGSFTYTVANNVRYILRDALSAAPASTITVVDDKGAAIVGASATPKVLTSTLSNLSLTLPTTVDLPSVRFKIELGDLEFFSSPFKLKAITLTPIKYEFDCHSGPSVVIGYNYDVIDWGGANIESSFIVSEKTAASFKITPKENVTPIRWEKLNAAGSGYDVSDESDNYAIPIFEDKVVSGNIPLELIQKSIPIELTQLSPLYIGRYGSPIDNSADPKYASLRAPLGNPVRHRAIVEARDEVPAGVEWGGDVATGSYNIFHNGKYISMINQSGFYAGSNVSNYALNECYSKNIGYLPGSNLSDSAVHWYLPAVQQLAGVWTSLGSIGYVGEQAFSSNDYRSATEGVSSGYSRIVNFGTGRVGSNANNQNDALRVRCVRDL